MKNELLDAAFEAWWAAECVTRFADVLNSTELSAMHTVASIAWSNGAYKAVSLKLSLDKI